MNLKQIVQQINRQLTISDSYEERRLLKIKESEDQLIYSEDDFDFFLIPIDGDVMEEQERLEGLFVSISGRLKHNIKSLVQIKRIGKKIITHMFSYLI